MASESAPTWKVASSSYHGSNTVIRAAAGFKIYGSSKYRQVVQLVHWKSGHDGGDLFHMSETALQS